MTNAGGPGVLAVDSLIRDGGELAELTPATIAELNTFLPGPWSHGNPIDILGDADAERYAKALQAAAKDPIQLASTGLPSILAYALSFSAVPVGSLIAWGVRTTSMPSLLLSATTTSSARA